MTDHDHQGALGVLIDHQASLQAQLDSVHRELAAFAATACALAVLVAVLAWKVRA